MPLKSFFLFCFLASIWVPAFAQTLPAGSKVPSLGGGLPKGIPTNGLEGLAAKAEIPYLEELRQVHELKKSFDSLPDEIKDKILQPFFTTKKGNRRNGAWAEYYP